MKRLPTLSRPAVTIMDCEFTASIGKKEARVGEERRRGKAAEGRKEKGEGCLRKERMGRLESGRVGGKGSLRKKNGMGRGKEGRKGRERDENVK